MERPDQYEERVERWIAGTPPGEKGSHRLIAATTPMGLPLEVPLVVMRGGTGGPTLGLLSGVHGDEGLSVLALARFCDGFDPAELKGTILAVPVANPPAFENRTRNNAWDQGDLVRLWPGKRDGTITERLAAAIFDEVIRRSDFVLDLHSGTPLLHESWALYANPRGPVPEISQEVAETSRGMALAFGVDQILRAHPWYTTVAAAGSAGVPTIVVEVGGGPDLHLRHDRYLEVMTRGITNVLKHAGMLSGPLEHDFEIVREYDIAEEFLAVGGSGLWHRTVGPGDIVAAGTLMGSLLNPVTGEEQGRVVASKAGTVLNPMVTWPTPGHGQWLMATGSLVEEHRIR
jgi:predicted deacylase